MTLIVRSFSAWRSATKIVLTLAFLVGQMPVQAAAPEVPGAVNPNDTGPVIVSTDKGKIPKRHRELKPGQVKPEKYPSRPQQQVRTLR